MSQSTLKSATSAIAIGWPDNFDYSFVSGASAWRDSPIKGIQCRDLGLSKASQGDMSANLLRLQSPLQDTATPEWTTVGSAFHLLYVLSGTARLESHAGKAGDLLPGTAAYLPANVRHRIFGASTDFVMLEIATRGAEPELKQMPAGADSRLHVLSEAKDSYIQGDGLRKYFAYRDLGSKSRSQGKVHIQTFHAVDIMPGGTGWHKHSNMCQFFYVIDGGAGFGVENDSGLTRLEAGDAVCMPKGRAHNVPSYTAAYKVLEMCIPGEFDTIPVDAPAWLELTGARSAHTSNVEENQQ